MQEIMGNEIGLIGVIKKKEIAECLDYATSVSCSTSVSSARGQ